MTSPNLTTARINLHRLTSMTELVELAMSAADWSAAGAYARQCATLANTLADALAGARPAVVVRLGVDHGRH